MRYYLWAELAAGARKMSDSVPPAKRSKRNKGRKERLKFEKDKCIDELDKESRARKQAETDRSAFKRYGQHAFIS